MSQPDRRYCAPTTASRPIVSDSEPDNQDRATETIGTTVGRYELLSKFATGGMAELFLARERGAGGLERLVVVKRLLPHLTERPESVEMFLREGRLVARLQHPNIVQTYEFGEEEGEYYLAMEYLHGSTLRELQWLREDGGEAKLPAWFSVSVVEQACRGLHAAHELKNLDGEPIQLVHRDVSPQNLMCTVEGFVKLLDFGVAKGAEGEEATSTGRVKGKFSYMSPEQFKRNPLDRRSDVFALGVVFWELLTGERLFKRETEPETMQAILEEEPAPPSSKSPEIPTDLDAVVRRALAKDREERYPTAEALRRDVVEVVGEAELLREENELAGFVESVASERLETRDVMIRESLERSLTEGERARLRHEYAAGSTRTGSPGGSYSFGDVLDGGSAEGVQGGGADSADSTPPERSEGAAGSGTPVEEAMSDGTDVDGILSKFGGVAFGVFTVLLSVVVGAATYWAGTGGSAGEPEGAAVEEIDVSGPPISYVFPPVQTEEVLSAELAPLVDYLERRLGRPVETVISESYAAASEGLRNGRYDVATLPPLTFVLTRRADPRIEPLAIREEAGAITNDGLILVRKSSAYDSLGDLRGATFCFTDKNSTSGNFLPRVKIRKQGWKPSEFIGEVHWSGNHLQGLRDLTEGVCDAAATYSGSLLSARNRGIQASGLRTVAITGHLPSGTVAVRPGLSDELTEKLRSAHLQFEPSKDVGKHALGKTLEITGYRQPREELFESLVDAVENYGDILERFGFSTVEGAVGGNRDAGKSDGPA